MLFAVAESAFAQEDPDEDPGAEAQEEREAREWLRRQRFPTGAPHGRAVLDAIDAWDALPPRLPDDPTGWVSTGPAPLATDVGGAPLPNAGPNSGRASAIAFDPTDPDVIYAAFGLGGVWKSTDAGASWMPIGDDLPTQSIGELLVDPRDPQTLWVGTGEDALWMGEGGRGLFVSHDGGGSFAHVGDDRWDGDAISRLLIDGEGRLYVGVAFGVHGKDGFCETSWADDGDHGLFRSTDDGAHFTRLREGDITDLAIDESVAPPLLILGDYDTGVWRSADDGASWVTPDGLPEVPWNLHVAIAPSDPLVVYAAGGVSGNRAGAFVSLDGGLTFAAIPGAPDYCYGQCYYQNAVAVDPIDPSRVFLGGGLCAVWRIDDATGETPIVDDVACQQNWTRSEVHPDTHDLVFDPSGALWAVEDGGLAVSSDGGTHWDQPLDGVATIQLYGICVDPADPVAAYAGAQDNGTMRQTADGWEGVTTGDGGPCAVSSGDPSTVIVSTQYASILRSGRSFSGGTPLWTFYTDCTNGPGCGDRAGFIAPLANHPGVTGRFYVGTYRLWASDDGAETWTPLSGDLTGGERSVTCFGAYGYPWDDVLTAIAASPSDPDTVYTGSEGGVLSSTHDHGDHWTTVGAIGRLPARWVTSLAVDAVDPDVAYAGFSAFDEDTPDAPGHVFKTTDGGFEWESLDLPLDVPVDALLAHPTAPGIVYAGTDLGLLISTDAGSTWSPLGEGLPRVPIYDLDWRDVGPTLVAGTYGRGAWELPLGVGHLEVSPAAIVLTAERDRPVDGAYFEVTNSDATGNVIPFDVTVDADWLALTADHAAAAGERPVRIAVLPEPQAEEGGYDAVIHVTGANGDAADIPVHLDVGKRGCGCDQSGGAGGIFGSTIGFGLLALRRRRRLSSSCSCTSHARARAARASRSPGVSLRPLR
jgi:hypothetical protein